MLSRVGDSSHIGSMEEPVVVHVSHPIGDAGGLPNPPPLHGGSDHTNTPRGCASSTASSSCMAYLRQHAELQFAAWRQKSSKSYDSLFRKWAERYNLDPVSGTISEVVNFLIHLFKEGYQYR